MSSSTHPRAEGASVDHAAADAALGYLYQAKWALLELLRGSVVRPDGAISIELYDDVAWDQGESPVELLQLKHHLRSSRELTDTSADVWRTIGVWLDVGTPLDPDGPLLTLLTTQIAADGTAMAALRPVDPAPDDALRLLEAAARQSTAASTQAVRARFMAMSPNSRAQFVRRIRVLDGSPTISEVDELVQRQLQFSIPRGHEHPFLERLWGWWFTQVLRMLRGEQANINAVALQIFLDDLRSEFVPDNLPTYAEIKLQAEAAAQYENYPFVHQLRWVAVPERNMRKAISDYYRTYAHIARWLQEDIIGLDELQRFEDLLVDEWEREFDWTMADLPDDADEQTKQAVGRRLLRARLEQASLRIRERYSEPFFARGKHHELSDLGQIGWHPEFRSRFEELALSKTA